MFIRQFKAGVEKKRYKFLVILFEFSFLYLALLSGADKEANKEIKNNSESIRRKKCPPVYDFCPLQRR